MVVISSWFGDFKLILCYYYNVVKLHLKIANVTIWKTIYCYDWIQMNVVTIIAIVIWMKLNKWLVTHVVWHDHVKAKPKIYFIVHMLTNGSSTSLFKSLSFNSPWKVISWVPPSMEEFYTTTYSTWNMYIWLVSYTFGLCHNMLGFTHHLPLLWTKVIDNYIVFKCKCWQT